MKKAWKPVEVNYVVFTGDDNELKTLVGCANRSGDVDWRLGRDVNGCTVISGYNGYHHWSEIVCEDMYVVQCGNDIHVCTPGQFSKTYMSDNPPETEDETSEPKFTEGPWQIDDDEGALRLFVYNEEHGNVCTVSLFDQRDREAVLLGGTPENDPDKKEYLDFDRIHANAALIAASPEMYCNEKSNMALLKVLREFIKTMMQEPQFIPLLDSLTTFIDKIDGRMAASERILRKARGEE